MTLRPADTVMPTIEEAFQKRPQLVRALLKAHFVTIAPLIMLPREALLDIPGIGISSMVHISKTLKRYGLEQYDASEDASDFIARLYPDISEAPLGILQVENVRGYGTDVLVFAPLQFLSVLEDHEPGAQVKCLTGVTRADLADNAVEHLENGADLENIWKDINAVEKRMADYGQGFAEEEGIARITSYPPLRSVK